MITQKGFTLIEILVALIISVLIIGSIMTLNSVSMQNQRRLIKLQETLPVLDAAAQKIFANPKLALNETLTLEEFEGKPMVEVEILQGSEASKQLSLPYGRLYRVRLAYKGETIEFSIIVSEP